MSVYPRKVPAGVSKLLPSVLLQCLSWSEGTLVREGGGRFLVHLTFGLSGGITTKSIYYCFSFLMALLKASNSSNVWWAPSPAMSNELSVTNSDVNSACTGQFAINMNPLASVLTVIFISLVDWAKGSAPKIPNSKTFSLCTNTAVQGHLLITAGLGKNSRCNHKMQGCNIRKDHSLRKHLGKNFSWKEELAHRVAPSPCPRWQRMSPLLMSPSVAP